MCYLDDLLLFGNSYELCALNVRKTTDLLVKAGFVINVTKSNLTPTKEIIFLGFTLNSENMSIALPEEKGQKTLADCENLAKNPTPTIRNVARVVGKLVASFPAVTYGPFNRCLERDKMTALVTK